MQFVPSHLVTNLRYLIIYTDALQDEENETTDKKCWIIRNSAGQTLIVSFAEMYDNSIYYLQSTPEPISYKSDNNGNKDSIVFQREVDSSSSSNDVDRDISMRDVLVIGSYLTIILMIAILLPLSYYLTLKVYNYVY